MACSQAVIDMAVPIGYSNVKSTPHDRTVSNNGGTSDRIKTRIGGEPEEMWFRE